MNPNKFSFSRFASFFRWYAAIGTKTTIKIAVALLLGSSVLVSVASWNHPLTDNSIYEAIFIVAGGVIASMALVDVNKNNTRQQFLSIPANNLEKYVAVLSLCIVRTIIAMIALCGADFIRAVIDMKNNDFCMVITNFSDTIVNPQKYFSLLLIYWFFNFIGGISVRKYAFMWGCIIGWSFMGAVIKMISAVLYNNKEIMTKNDAFLTAPPLWGSIIIVLILIILPYMIDFKKIMLNTGYYQHNRFANRW